MSREASLQLSFADVEFQQQEVFLDPTLQVISRFLDEQQEMIEQVRADLQRGLKNPYTGRDGLTPAQVLRSLILMRIKNWDYRELRERIADGYTLRLFTGFLSQPVPQHHAFNRAFNRLTPETMKAVNERVIRSAVDLGLEDGKKLRVDCTVVETEIHHPTDNTLLWDTVRVVTRLVGRLEKAIGRKLKGFPRRTRAARRRMQEIQRLTPKQRQEKQTKKYQQLIGITEQVVTRARHRLKKTEKTHGQNLQDDLVIAELRREIEHYCQLGERVLDQTRRRVLHGEQVPAGEKIYSIFEPHTDLIKRGKIEKPIEFGHKVFLAESAQGLITQYEVLEGNPPEEQQVPSSLENHRKTFGHAPDVYGTDRGFYSEDNLKACKKDGVKVASMPQRGGQKTSRRKAHEKSAIFKMGQRFRAGIEGRISVLFRGRGMKRCLAKGRERFQLLVGAAVLANNLLRIGALLIESSTSKQQSAA